MSSRDMKDARRVNVDFEDVPIRRGGRRDREHEREPPPRQQAPPGPARRREGFGARLTTNANPSTSSLPTPPTQSRRASPSPPRDTVDPALLQYVCLHSISPSVSLFLGSITRSSPDCRHLRLILQLRYPPSRLLSVDIVLPKPVRRISYLRYGTCLTVPLNTPQA